MDISFNTLFTYKFIMNLHFIFILNVKDFNNNILTGQTIKSKIMYSNFWNGPLFLLIIFIFLFEILVVPKLT